MTTGPRDLIQHLKASQVFGGVGEGQLQPVLPLCEEVTVEKGAHIFAQGDPARSLYIVRRGRVALERPDGSVTHTTTVASVGPGDALGWSAFVEPHLLTLSATAVERSDLIVIEAQRLRDVLDRSREMGYLVMVNVTRLLAERLMQTREAFVYERDWVFQEKKGQ